jgi:hypothetical protein
VALFFAVLFNAASKEMMRQSIETLKFFGSINLLLLIPPPPVTRQRQQLQQL